MINSIIIDDEPLAVDLINEYIDKTRNLNLLGFFYSPIEAKKFIYDNKIDLIFLDIEMHEMNGFDLIEFANESTQIILTTAYQNYAIQSYDYNITDYLLKPISFKRFSEAIKKVELPKGMKTDFFINTGRKLENIKINDIQLIKSEADYIKIVTDSKSILARYNLYDIKNKLTGSSVIQIHRSYLVNINKIEVVEGNYVVIKNKKIPISKSFKSQFLNEINKKLI
jgi:DNA-binding LytR/AlgR family response regulator